jgi:hypothetical protein
MTQAVRTKKWQRSIAWSIILAESTHVFCCVLPTVVTVMAVLASFGAMTQMPVFILDLHAALHGYEVPVIIFSAPCWWLAGLCIQYQGALNARNHIASRMKPFVVAPKIIRGWY